LLFARRSYFLNFKIHGRILFVKYNFLGRYTFGSIPFFDIFSLLRYSVCKEILELIAVRPDLPPLPKVFLGLKKLMNNPDCEVEDVYRLLKTDPVLSGSVITIS
jgi:hypothetical protein